VYSLKLIFTRFFSPAIQAFAENNEIFLFCLSNGGFDGLGREREKELEQACRALNFNDAPTCIDIPELQDGMDANWDT
jgi:LmbE family N-acetylglucosaminyl deacetylase